MAVPDLVGSATEVATTLTCAGDGTLGGAVYTPSCVTTPHPELLQAAPLSDHVTPVIVVPPTYAKKRCWLFSSTVDWVGEMVTVTFEDWPIITEALAEALRSASEVAVTAMAFELGVVVGAV
jgi:hypothetical protein